MRYIRSYRPGAPSALPVAALLAALLTGCASLPSLTAHAESATPASAAASASASRAAAAAAAAHGPSSLRPFAEVTKDATHTDRLFSLSPTDDKLWPQLTPSGL